MATAVRIVVIDYYLSAPVPGLDVTYSEFRGTSVNQVPILRCFGSNEDGKKICVHIHGVFPYLYIPYDGTGDVESVMYQLASSIDRAVNTSLNQASSPTQHVYKMSLVSGIPMYGYHPKKHQFFKIYLYNPMLVTTISNLLINKCILDSIYQPHEAHINYTLQFMIDYNLHGMSKLIISEIKYRGTSIVTGDVYLPPNIEKITVCELEGDINANHIINQQEIINGKLAANPGIAALWADERQRLRNKNQESQLGDFLELKNTDVPPTKTHFIFKQALSERLAVLSTDKDVAKPDLEASVYAAETPTDTTLQNASLVDIHTPSSLELSLDDTLNKSVSIMDYTMSAENLNVTVDEDAQVFLQILEDLAEEKKNKEELEQDSILSQKLNEEQADDSLEEGLDLSLPLASMTTPQKIVVDVEPVNCLDDDDDDLFNKTLIPQLDGQGDISDSDSDNSQVHKVKTRICGRSMTLLCCSDENSSPIMKNTLLNHHRELIVRIEPLNMSNLMNGKPPRKTKQNFKTASEKLTEQLRLIKFRINRVLKKRRLKRLVKTIRKKDIRFHDGMRTFGLPKFNVVSGPGKRSETFYRNNGYVRNIYVNCDGAADDSSSEGEKSTKRTKSKVTTRLSQYAPLHIQVTQSPNQPQTSITEAPERDKSLQESSNHDTSNRQQLLQSQSYKRRISFDAEFSGNYTVTEEYMSCGYSPRPPKEKAKLSCQERSPTTKADSHNSDSDIFSEDDHLNTSFFKTHDFDTSVSAKYDFETNYTAKEGCSTVFTPSSFPELKSSSSAHEEQTFSSGKCSSTEITPYQLHQSQKFEDENGPHHSPRSVVVLKPVLRAPSRIEIERYLSENNISRVKHQEPFYSDVNDYAGVMEIGHRTLRIASKCSVHLQEFETQYDSLNKYRKQFAVENNLILNAINFRNIKLSHCTNRDVIVRPLKKAPSVKEVKEWLKERLDVQECSPKSEEIPFEKSKLIIPNSPGRDGDDSDVTLSLTPCTPLSPKAETPTKKECKSNKELSVSDEANKSCQITGLTQSNSFGFDNSVQDFQAARAVIEHQHLTTMVMELHVRTRGNFKPDPEYDTISAIFYSVLNDVPETHAKKSRARGVIALNRLPLSWNHPNNHLLDGVNTDCDIHYADSEEVLITLFLDQINYWDPDILTGYEIQMLSWGYLIDRAFVLSLNLIPLLGRSQINKYGRSKLKPSKYDLETDITGRIILDAWRLMRHEIALQSYTFESIVYHILHKRTAQFSFKTLSFWWDHRTNHFRHRVVNYYLLRVDTILELFQKLDFINRTSELAKLFGIMFYEVLSRGSQFRVESMMLRLAKPLNYLPVSPNVNQRAHMKAPEFVPLIMEPESKLYNDPVIVLDFQSLYPSIIIAYNYCFTTCLGRVRCLGTNSPFEFGSTQLKVSKRLTEKLSKRDLLNFTPCGVAFVKRKVREGVLPRMLKEILNTRLMVKNAMKQNKRDNNLQKVLHSRQLGLKLIANVTFGYTAASFSGRMSCVEIMDSILSKARETLQRAIAMVESTPEWGGKVVYGDTDSLFVTVPGKTKQEAFEIGKKIADAITNENPDPIKLKLEKVYQPCILQTKKRYVGYMYESPEQVEPVYEAKGIETVRRDGCPAVSKMLQKCLVLLFETKDVSSIKKYVVKQFHKILAGRATIQDLTFAKEYRGAGGYKAGACVPALELARKWRAVDRRSEPRSAERVPYVIVNGPPGLPLIRLVRSPRDLLNDPSLRPNALYYITKVIIPPLNRCLSLIGADVNIWFNQMPRRTTQYLPNSSPTTKSTISQYFTTKMCACCSQSTQEGLCAKCHQEPAATAITLAEKLRRWEKSCYDTNLVKEDVPDSQFHPNKLCFLNLQICHCCTGHQENIICISLDCPVLYRRNQTYNDLQQATYVRELFYSTFSENNALP